MYTCQCEGLQMGQSSGVLLKEVATIQRCPLIVNALYLSCPPNHRGSQHRTCTLQHIACTLQRRTCTLQHVVCKLQHRACIVQHNGLEDTVYICI